MFLCSLPVFTNYEENFTRGKLTKIIASMKLQDPKLEGFEQTHESLLGQPTLLLHTKYKCNYNFKTRESVQSFNRLDSYEAKPSWYCPTCTTVCIRIPCRRYTAPEDRIWGNNQMRNKKLRKYWLTRVEVPYFMDSIYYSPACL